MKKSGSKILMALTLKDEESSTTSDLLSEDSKSLLKVSSRMNVASLEAMDTTGQSTTVKE